MLQFIDKIGVQTGFVDLHNHTDRSFGDERNRMNLSPVDLLDSALEYSKNNNNALVTFSVTDHNNFDSIFEITKKISENPKLYQNIRFIKGCEFSCSGAGFGTTVFADGKKHRMVRKLHVLAYDFDENNKKLQFVTKLYDDTVKYIYPQNGVKVSTGRYILALRNIMFDKGQFLPLEDFFDFELKKNGRTLNQFIDDLLLHCKQKYKFSDSICEELKYKLTHEELFKNFKIDALEIAEIVQEAGGYIVLAHPSLITYGKNYEKTFRDIQQEYKSLNHIKFVISKFKNFCSPYTGKFVKGMIGMEALHSSSFGHFKSFGKLINIARDNKLYITGGSDSHGSLMRTYFSEIFPKSFSLNTGINLICMTENFFADMVYNKNIVQNMECNLPYEMQIKLVEFTRKGERKFQFSDILDRMDYVQSLKHEKKLYNVNPKKSESEVLIEKQNLATRKIENKQKNNKKSQKNDQKLIENKKYIRKKFDPNDNFDRYNSFEKISKNKKNIDMEM